MPAYRNDRLSTSILLSVGADTSVTDVAGRPALMIATNLGHTKVVKMLVEGGADIDVADKYGKTALTLAEKKDFAEIAKILRAAHEAKEGARRRDEGSAEPGGDGTEEVEVVPLEDDVETTCSASDGSCSGDDGPEAD